MFNENSWLTIRRNGRVETIQAKMLDEIVGVGYGANALRDDDIEIMSRDGFTQVKSVYKKKWEEKDALVHMNTDYGVPLFVEKSSIIPVDRKGKYTEIIAPKVERGDKLYTNKHKSVEQQFTPRMLSVPKELAKNAVFDDITQIRRYIYAEYGVSLEEALTYCGLTELKTVEDYNTFSSVYPIATYIEESLHIIFGDGSRIPFRIDNMYEFVLEGGYFLTHRYQMKNSKYPKAVLDVYFNNRIPNEVMYGLPIVKTAFFAGCAMDMPYRFQYLWATDDEMLFRDFMKLLKTVGYKSAYEEKITQKDSAGNLSYAWAFKFWSNNETLAWRSSHNKIKTEIQKINSRPKNDHIATTVNHCHLVKADMDMYDVVTADGFCVVNGYIVKASSK